MTTRRVLMHCNAGARFGMGHLMRCLSLAEQALSRGWEITLIGEIDDTGVALASRLVPSVDLQSVPLARLGQALELGGRRGAEVVHIDSYWETPQVPLPGALVSNMQDGPFGVRPADLAIDANLGAETWFEQPEASASQLAGIDAAVIRQQVLRQRGPRIASAESPRVLIVMGGTDPAGLTARVIHGLRNIPGEVRATAVTASEEAALAAAESPHPVEVVGFVDDLPALARDHDLVITAAGTSVWDFACMGLPMALVCAVENQVRGYRAVLAGDLAIGLGEPPHEGLESRVGQLSDTLSDATRLRSWRERLMQSVDGLGSWRIVAAWEQLTLHGTPQPAPARSAGLVGRPATIDDADLLFEWRNDPVTRQNSRQSEALSWQAHVSWLERCLEDDDRRLLIVEDQHGPVGTVRWDRRSASDWEASITVAPQQRGRGLARAVLAAGERALAIGAPVRMLAGIHQRNAASQRLFASAGYLPHTPADPDGFALFAKWRWGAD